MTEKPLAFIDLETTGTNVSIHEIIEIGCVLVRQQITDGEASFEVLDEFELKVHPRNISVADPTALKINQYEPGRWVFAYSLKQALEEFSKRVGDAIMVGHNVSFDVKFLDTAFAKTEVENSLHYAKLDTLSMAYIALAHREDIYKYSLQSLCKYYDIPHKEAHTALADAQVTFAVYKKLLAASL